LYSFSRQAVGVVLGVALEEDKPELVGADRHVDAALLAIHQRGQTSRFQLIARDVVES
jgi:hypothetical protein